MSLIIDCHGHYTTAPTAHNEWRDAQKAAFKAAAKPPPYPSISDDEIREGIRLLAECEGVFAETAGGVTVGVARKLIAQGRIPADGSAVLCITGNGLKTLEAMTGHVGATRDIRPSLREFEALLAHDQPELVNA